MKNTSWYLISKMSKRYKYRAYRNHLLFDNSVFSEQKVYYFTDLASMIHGGFFLIKALEYTVFLSKSPYRHE